MESAEEVLPEGLDQVLHRNVRPLRQIHDEGHELRVGIGADSRVDTTALQVRGLNERVHHLIAERRFHHLAELSEHDALHTLSSLRMSV